MRNTAGTHAAMMQNENAWPHWPFLPLTRGDEVGILVAGQGPVVYLVNLFTVAKKLATAEKLPYESFEKLIEAGWIVD